MSPETQAELLEIPTQQSNQPETTTETNNEPDAQVLYDADAEQTSEFEITQDEKKYDSAHVYKPFTDERHIAYVKTINHDFDAKKAVEIVRAAKILLWRDLIKEIKNIETVGGVDFRDLVDEDNEIIPSIDNFIIISIVEPEKVSGGVRPLVISDEVKVVTECFFNYPNTAQQTHRLKKGKEWAAKFQRIAGKQWKEEKIGGLRREPKVIFTEQIEAFGKLYDEMLISVTGFKDDKVPARFRIKVLDYIFTSTLNEKK